MKKITVDAHKASDLIQTLTQIKWQRQPLTSTIEWNNNLVEVEFPPQHRLYLVAPALIETVN